MARGRVCWFGSKSRNDRPASPTLLAPLYCGPQLCRLMYGVGLTADRSDTTDVAASIDATDTSRAAEAAGRGALLLWRQPGLGHSTFDDVALNPFALRTPERSQVPAE